MEFRQVHLDFHTSEHIEGIGEKFNKVQFQEALLLGKVESITLFSKCHHGWSYHPTKVNEMHPHLSFDLLGAQIEAAHEIGVKTPVYLSAGHDEKVAVAHPEWQTIDPKEHENGDVKFPYYGFHLLCLNTPYLDMLLSQIKEVVENYDADGIFLDILNDEPCFCPACQKIMRERKMEINLENAIKLGRERYLTYAQKVRETVDSVKPGLPVFHNAGHIKRGRMDIVNSNTHLELESLPTGGWGYDHFPISATYARNLGKEISGMTGKFHKTWGEFGGFKHPNALRYETALSLALGAKICIGDQLHPSGEMDIATYDLIGKAYSETSEKQPWCENAEFVADIAVLDSEAMAAYYENKANSVEKTDDSAAGCVRILLEGHYLFDFIDANSELDKYKLLILAENVRIDEKMQKKIKAFIRNGGKLLACGEGGLSVDKDEFCFDFGSRFVCKNKYRPDYIRPAFEIPSLKKSAYVMYSQGFRINPARGTELAKRENPYFNRENFKFCSHQHTPPNAEDLGCGISAGCDGIYIAWNIFEDYAQNGTIYVKEIVSYLIDLLLVKRTASATIPAQGVISLAKQKGRKVLHLLYASPVRRGKETDVIEDILPVYQTKVTVKCDNMPKKVYLAPQMEEMDFEYSGGYVSLVVPEFENHCMVVIED